MTQASRSNETVLKAMGTLSIPYDPKGVCHGLATMAIQAWLYGGLASYEKFNQRLRFLEDYSNEMGRLKRLILMRKNKLRSPRFQERSYWSSYQLFSPAYRYEAFVSKELSDYDRKLLEIEPFLQNVSLYQEPWITHEKLPGAFADLIKQHDWLTLAKSEVLGHPAFSAVRSKNYLIRKNDFSYLLHHSDHSCCLVVRSKSHAISIIYDAENKKWLMTNHSHCYVLSSAQDAYRKIRQAFPNDQILSIQSIETDTIHLASDGEVRINNWLKSLDYIRDPQIFYQSLYLSCQFGLEAVASEILAHAKVTVPGWVQLLRKVSEFIPWFESMVNKIIAAFYHEQHATEQLVTLIHQPDQDTQRTPLMVSESNGYETIATMITESHQLSANS